MLESLQQIDTSVIEELVALKQERETVAARLAKMEEDRGKVSDVVYRRVKRDYETRVSGIERKAAPLKEQARKEFAKLKKLLEEIEAKLQASKLDKEEMEFRNRLGEFEDAEFKKRVSDAEELLDKTEGDLAEANEVKDQFVDAFDSEDDLATPVSAKAPEPPAGAPEVVTVPSSATTLPPNAPLPPIASPPPPPALVVPLPPTPAPGADADGTMILGAEAPPTPQRGGTAAAAVDPQATTRPHPSQQGGAGGTVILLRGKLVAIDTDLGANEFALEPLTFVGRTPENQVRLNKPTVSRRHAQVTLSDGGYTIRDLQSENGTYVNGERIHERLLAHGDRVQIGTVRFVFQMS